MAINFGDPGTAEEGKPLGVTGFIDSRDDPEGFIFASWSDDAEERVRAVQELRESKVDHRSAMFGVPGNQTIQPLSYTPPKEN
jgi:hypothetical protein